MTASNLIYLDNAATSFPKPEQVYVAVDSFMRHCGAPFARGSHAGTADADRIVAQCRSRLATLIDAAHADELAFAFNATDALNLLLRGLLRQGDRVITTQLEHNSVLRPLEQLRTEVGITVDVVPVDPATGVVDVQQLAAAVGRAACRLVVVNHASNVTGIVQPLQQIISLAHDANALVLVDAAQSAGHISFSVRELGIDLLAAAGHKGLLGPLGTGFVYVNQRVQDQLISVRCGGTGTDSDSITQPQHMPHKLESGNLNLPGIAGLNAALEWLAATSVGQVHHDIAEHTNRLISGLQGIDSIRVYCAEDRDAANNCGIVSFNIQGIDCRETAMMLEQSFGIRCRAGLHCAPLMHKALDTSAIGGTVRFSPGPFTTAEEIDRTLEAVAVLAQSLAG